MDYSDLRNKITGWNKDIPPSILDDLIDQALRRFYDEHNWSFLIDSTAIWVAPKLISGSVNVVQYSNQVTIPPGTLKTFIDNISVNNVPIVGRQFRVDSGTVAPHYLYTITDYDSPSGVLTLNNYYLDEDATVDAKIFKCYYEAPQRLINNTLTPDFKQLLFVIDYKSQRKLNTALSFQLLNQRDPNRWYYSTIPYAISAFDASPEGVPQFELYPFYSDGSYDRAYKVIYMRQGLAFENDTDKLPYYINSNILLEAAKLQSCEWAEANKGNYPSLQKTNWLNLRALLGAPANVNSTGYAALLRDAIKMDENAAPKALWQEYRDMAYLNDGSVIPYAYENWDQLVYTGNN